MLQISSPELSSRGGLLSEEAHTPEDWLVSGPNSYDQLPHIPRSESPEPPSTYRQALMHFPHLANSFQPEAKIKSLARSVGLRGFKLSSKYSTRAKSEARDLSNIFGDVMVNPQFPLASTIAASRSPCANPTWLPWVGLLSWFKPSTRKSCKLFPG